MILAAAEHAEGNGPPPPELTKAWECRRWHSLPRSGGLDDQPVNLMMRMNAALSVYEAMRVYASADRNKQADEAWMKANPRTMALWTRVQILRAQQ